MTHFWTRPQPTTAPAADSASPCECTPRGRDGHAGAPEAECRPWEFQSRRTGCHMVMSVGSRPSSAGTGCDQHPRRGRAAGRGRDEARRHRGGRAARAHPAADDRRDRLPAPRGVVRSREPGIRRGDSSGLPGARRRHLTERSHRAHPARNTSCGGRRRTTCMTSARHHDPQIAAAADDGWILAERPVGDFIRVELAACGR